MTQPTGESAVDRGGRYLSPSPERLSADQLAVYASIVEGPRKSQAGLVPVLDDDGRLLGPFALMAIAPRLGEAVQAVGAALRFDGQLSAAARELSILVVAVHHRCDFEWFAHEHAARAAGLSTAQLASIRAGAEPVGLDTEGAAVWASVTAILQRGGLDETEYAAAVDVLGEALLAELVWLCGYYAMLAVALATFDPVLPEAARGAVRSANA